jgi:tRNA 2-thiouridine synthesizing protein A
VEAGHANNASTTGYTRLCGGDTYSQRLGPAADAHSLIFDESRYRVSEAPSPIETLDCVGLFCPEPLFQTREAIDELQVGDVLEVLADDPAAEEDLTRFAKRAGHEVVSVEDGEGFKRFLIRKGR